MANIKVTLDYPIIDGQAVTFKAPCDCTAVTGVKIYYPNGGSTASKVFTFKDAHGNNLAGVNNLFVSGSYVKVVVNTTDNVAYIQNADTNAYLEGELAKKYSPTNKPTAADVGAAASSHNHSATEITSGTLPVARGGTGNTSVDTTPTSGSTKMVTSGGVYSALSGKAASSHNHAASEITSGTFDAARIPSLAASKISAGTFSATGVVAATGTDYTTQRIRNIAASTTDLTAGSSSLANGNIYIVYE